ncbi:DUF2177 domain-containing protein [Legionella longbeachae]|nr:DUF2177 domain-containing protein [Legionella longbeachae]EEZ94384.1 conserved hypothetical protein [Legionella longbeachae D-4968]VEE03053.1 membrane protein [Legionella oakridgensis]ARM32813.1 DUF2177 family protein [Legionella longbeachae]QEY53253.1 DUF2177 family protein [Legionella longbeachae]
MKLIGLFFLTMIWVFVLDMIWLGFIAKTIYAENIGTLLRTSGEGMAPIWWAAAVVYVCITLGIIYFVLPGAQGNYLQALAGGVVLGFVTYGIYDFTNYSILASWPWKITIIDFIWGMLLCGLSSLFAVFIQNRFFS